MQTALVTGAAGFVGSHVCQYLLEQGYRVKGLVRSTRQSEQLESWGVEAVLGDVTRPETLPPAVLGCETVFHLAGVTKASTAEIFDAVNSTGTRNLLAACQRPTSPPVFVLVSTLAVAGPAPQDRPHTEEDPPYPISMYGRSKLAGEQIGREFAGQLPVSIVRPPMVCGERDQDMRHLFNVVKRWGVMAIPGFQHHRYSIIHALDLARALVMVAEQGERLLPVAPSPGFGVYYAAAEERPTLMELGRRIAGVLNSPPPKPLHLPPRAAYALSAVVAGVAKFRGKSAILNPDKVKEALAGSWICSAEKLRRQFGFTTPPLDERLKQTAGWYREHGWLIGA